MEHGDVRLLLARIDLVATTNTGAVDRRRRRASWASSSVIPDATSTTSRTSWASSIARTACRPASASTPFGRWRYPAVSTSPNRLPFHVASSSTRSRVTPGSSCAIASRLPNSRLTSVDLPTFCRPTTAIRGTLTARGPGRSSGAALGDDRERTCERVVHVEIARVDHDRVLGAVRGVHAGIPRSRSWSAPATSLGPPAPRHAGRRAPGLRHRNSFTGASGKTAVPMSRPSITAPPSPGPVARRIGARTAGCLATALTFASTSADSARPRAARRRSRVPRGRSRPSGPASST